MAPTNANDPLHPTDHDPSVAPSAPDVLSDIAPSSPPGNVETATFALGEGTAPRPTSVSVPGYEIECVLGRGGMGVVYKARHLKLQRTVALKMVLAGGDAGPSELARFRIEAQAVARLQHPNIVQIHEVGEAGGHPFCALEFVEGGNLASKLNGKPMSAREAAKLVESLARAMQLAHSRNVVHRDLKPANILLRADGTPKITDFGLARQMDSDSGETQAGAVMGTPSYMAPEQASGHAHEAGPAADVYSLGAILYDCLAGRPPFKGKTVVETLDQVRTQEPTAPSRFQASVPLDLETICLKCLRKEPENRYASAAELADELVRYQQGEPILARPVGRSERAVKWVKRNPVVAGAALAVVLSMAVGTTVSYLKYVEADHERTVADGERTTAQNERIKAQNAEQKMKRIAEKAGADKDIAQRENYRSTIKLAESMLQGDAQARYRVADTLWGAQPELRGWEWGHLMARCPLEEWSLETNQDGLEALTASPDGRFLATAGRDGTVALWDSWTRKELWRRKTGRATQLDIDPRNRYLGAVWNHEVRILDIATGQIVNEASGDPKDTARIAFSPSGKDLYILRTELLERMATDTWARLASAPRKIGNQSVFVDLAGAFVGVHAIESPSKERRTALFDAHTLQPVADLDAILPVNDTNLVSWGKPVLHSGLGELVYSDGPGVFINTLGRDGKPQRQELFQHPTVIHYLAYDPRSQTAIAANWDGTVTLQGGDGEIRTLSHGSPITRLAQFPDGRFVTGGADGLLKCWKPGQAASLAVATDASPSSASALILAFADDGKQLLYRTWEHKSHFLFNMSHLTFRKFDCPVAGGYGPEWPQVRPATTELVVNDRNGAGLSFYGLSGKGTGLDKTQSIAFSNPCRTAFDASGRIMAVSSNKDEVAVFDVRSNQRFPVPEVRGAGVTAVNPAGTRAALRTLAGLQVWDVATGRLLHRLDAPTESFRNSGLPIAPVFHPDGDLIMFNAVTEGSSSLLLWDTALGKMRASIQTQPQLRITTYEFSPDGNRILACDETRLRIWDWRIGKELFALSDAKQTAHVASSPDGVTIAVSGWNPSLRIAKALPWNKVTRRNADFYRAVDDLWIYTAQRALKTKEQTIIRENQAALIHKDKEETTKWVKEQMTLASADEAEILGDIQRRRGQTDKALSHYTKAIEIRQTLVRADPRKAQWQYRLATVYEKRLAIETAGDPAKGVAVLQQAVEFREALSSSGKSHPLSWRYVLDYRSRYTAAVVATLAAARDDAMKAKLRRQTLDALKADLNTWSKLLDAGPPQARLAIVRTLNQWQQDSDLAGIRDDAALAKLPAGEQKAFTQLWADVAALLKEAEAKMYVRVKANPTKEEKK